MKLLSAAFSLLLSAKMGFAATCGGGSRGDGMCSGGICCSEWGWCGTSDAHCSFPSPTPPTGNPPPGAFCGCSTCSQAVWDTLAGDYTCGARITWLQNAQGYEEDDACSAVTSEFPDICRCGPSCGGNPPTPPVNPPTPTPPTGNPPSDNLAAVESVLEASKDGINNNILLYKTPSNEWVQSDVYRYDDFLAALRVMYNEGIAGKFFYLGDESSDGHIYGLVNIAAFLAQSMKETIQYNACDENSWDNSANGRYPLSNACGQLGQSYQDYKCSASEAHMECPVNKNMEITATTNAQWYGAPAPLFCGPKERYPFTGFWDYSKECNRPWASPPETCDVYSGQQAGGFSNSSPEPNHSGRTDVEGCCFWGRGVIQTTGVCNFGKLNYFLGAAASARGVDARYPDIDFCTQPDAICASQEHKELKWIAGLFYWIESLQSYSEGGWDYITELKKFVDDGMSGQNFINAVSGIVNRGCHNPPCSSGSVDGGPERASNFDKVLTEFGLR